MIVNLAQPSNVLESCHAQERVTIPLIYAAANSSRILLRHVFHYPPRAGGLLYSAARLEFIGNYASPDQDHRRPPVA